MKHSFRRTLASGEIKHIKVICERQWPPASCCFFFPAKCRAQLPYFLLNTYLPVGLWPKANSKAWLKCGVQACSLLPVCRYKRQLFPLQHSEMVQLKWRSSFEFSCQRKTKFFRLLLSACIKNWFRLLFQVSYVALLSRNLNVLLGCPLNVSKAVDVVAIVLYIQAIPYYIRMSLSKIKASKISSHYLK